MGIVVGATKKYVDEVKASLPEVSAKAIQEVLGVLPRVRYAEMNAKNLWDNPSMLNAGKMSGTRANVVAGADSLKVTATEAVSSGAGVSISSVARPPLPPTSKIHVAVSCRRIVGNFDLGITVQFLQGTTSLGNQTQTPHTLTSSWSEYGNVFEVPAGADNFRVYLNMMGNKNIGDAMELKNLMVATVSDDPPELPMRFFSGSSTNVYGSELIEESYKWDGAVDASTSTATYKVTSYEATTPLPKNFNIVDEFNAVASAKITREIPMPELNFRGATPFSVFVNSGRYISNCTEEQRANDFINSNTPTWVSPTGTASGNGTPENPMTFSAAMTAKKPLIYLTSGIYYNDTATVASSSATHSHAIVGVEPGVRMTGYYNKPAYTKEANGLLTYNVKSSGVVDYTPSLMIDGVAKTYTSVSSLAAVTTPGTWYSDTTSTYVMPHTETSPDNLMLSGVVRTGFFSSAPLTISKNVTYEGVWGACQSSGGTFVGIDSNFDYCPIGNGLNITGGRSFSFRCQARGNLRDGFNYHEISSSVFFYEEQCRAYQNGMTKTNTSSNATTAHETANGVRVMCEFWDCYGPMVADVNSTITYNFGLNTTRNYAPYSHLPHYQSDGSSTGGCKMYNYGVDCSGLGTYFKVTTSGYIENRETRLYDPNRYDKSSGKIVLS